MTHRQKTVLLRFGRTLAAAVVAAVVAWLASPEVADVIPKAYIPLVTVALTPMLTALEKSLRYGKEPGEGEGEDDDVVGDDEDLL